MIISGNTLMVIVITKDNENYPYCKVSNILLKFLNMISVIPHDCQSDLPSETANVFSAFYSLEGMRSGELHKVTLSQDASPRGSPRRTSKY